MRDLLHDLALKIARIGRDPKTRPVLLRPETGRREIAERLADAGAGLEQRDARRTRLIASREGIGRRIAIGGLLRSLLARRPNQLRQPAARVVGRDGERAWLVRRLAVFPSRQTAPRFKAGKRRLCRFRLAEHRDDRRRPAPAGAVQRRRQRPRHHAHAFGHLGELRHESLRGFAQRPRRLFLRLRRQQAECPREPKRARHERRGRPHEGEEFEHVEQGTRRRDLQTTGDEGGMRDEDVPTAKELARFFNADTAAGAIGCANDRAAGRRHQSGQRAPLLRGKYVACHAKRSCGVASGLKAESCWAQTLTLCAVEHSFGGLFQQRISTMPPGRPDLAMSARAWPFEEARKIVARIERRAKAGKGTKEIVFETGYGPSGLPHIGTFGEVARTTWVRHAFEMMSPLKTRLIAISDDMDGMRRVPDNVPNREMLTRYLGMPLTSVPDPYGTHASYGDNMNARLRAFLDNFGFEYDFRSATALYKSGAYDAALLKILANYDKVMEIMLPTLGEERQQTY